MKTQTIAGHEITLSEGNHYIATRPMGQSNPVSIKGMNSGHTYLQFDGLLYNEANELINAFNNDPRGSFYGRKWS